MKTIKRGLIGLQDINRGQSTFIRTTSTGGTQTLSQVPFPVDVQYVDGSLSRGGVDIGDEINKAYAAFIFNITATAASVTSNVATLVLASNPVTFGLYIGVFVDITGFTGADTYFNVHAQLTGVSSTSITFALTHANGTATTSGTVSANRGGKIIVAGGSDWLYSHYSSRRSS